jgi:phospholipid/cholesterol/gamma-HCH transport system permease protein
MSALPASSLPTTPLPATALPATAPTTMDALALALRPWRLAASDLVRRLDDVLPGSLLLVGVTVAAVGVALGDQASRQAIRLVGDQSFIGPEYIVLGVEEFVPLIVALALAQRVGAGFAAEVATLQSEDTLDALTLYGEEPARTVLAPMAIALVVGGVCLGLLGFVAWEVAGIATMWARAGTNPFTFFHPEAVHLSGLLLLVSKCAAFGALVFIAATNAGLAARGGAEAVGSAATRAVVRGVVYCLSASLLFDVAIFIWRTP